MPFLQNVGIKGREELIIHMQLSVALSPLNIFHAVIGMIGVSSTTNITQHVHIDLPMYAITVTSANYTPETYSSLATVGQITASDISSIIEIPTIITATIGALQMTGTVL